MALIVLLDEEDDRTVEDFAALSADEIVDQNGDALIGTARTVLLARPGERHHLNPFGSPTVFNPGRYLIFDLVPVGADPLGWKGSQTSGP